MEALQNFFIDNYEIVTLVVVGVCSSLIFTLFVFFGNMSAGTKEGEGFRRSFASQILAFALGAIAMYLWGKYM